MIDWFFYQDRGSTAGPVTLDEIRARVRDGRLRAFDLIYKEGETSWKMAMEHQDLRDTFREAGQVVSTARPWVSLRRKSDDNFDFVTEGPLSDDEIKSALASGRLGYNDYVWRDGYQDWKRIGGVETFNPRARVDESPAAPPAPTGPELLDNVVEFKRGAGHAAEPPPPPEADSEDLTTPGFAPNPGEDGDEGTKIIVPRRGRRRAVTESGPPPPPRTRTKNTRDESFELGDSEKARVATGGNGPTPAVAAPRAGSAPFIPRTPRREEVRQKRTRDGLIVAILAVLVVGAVSLVLLSRLRRGGERVTVAAPPPAPPVAGTASSAGSTPATNAPVPTPGSKSPTPAEENAAEETEDNLPPPKAPREPTRLSLSARVVNGHGVVEAHTNAPADAPFYLQIIGPAGQIANAPAFYHFARARSVGAIDAAVEFKIPPLGPGFYQINAEVAGEAKQITLAVAMGESKTKAALNRQRKLGAAALWRERLELFRLSQMVSSSLAKTKHPLSGRDFKALDQVKRTSGEKHLFFAEWWELKQIVEEARRRVTPELIARAKAHADQMATLSVQKSRT